MTPLLTLPVCPDCHGRHDPRPYACGETAQQIADTLDVPLDRVHAVWARMEEIAHGDATSVHKRICTQGGR